MSYITYQLKQLKYNKTSDILYKARNFMIAATRGMAGTYILRITFFKDMIELNFQ